MNFELVTVHEHYGNNFCGSREAKFYENRTLEYLPEPVCDDEDYETQAEEEDEDLG